MRNLLVLIFLVAALGVQAQDKITWLTFEEAVAKNEKDPKPMLIDLYTDWCGWCKKMDQNTYSNKVIANYINKNYYAVKLNGEAKRAITFRGKKFVFKAQGRRGYHELAAAIMNGNMSYPSTAFLNKEMQLLQNVPGYKDSKYFEKIISFFGEEAYKTTSWEDFQKNFKGSI